MVLTIGCSGNIPTEPETINPPDTVIKNDNRKWSAPKIVPLSSTSSYPRAVVAEGDNIHLLVVVPGDTLEIHDRFELAYLSYDGLSWITNTRISGFGIFKPAGIIPGPNGQLHFFWAGVRSELQQSPPSHLASDLFHCVWEGESCSEPASLYARNNIGLFVFQEPNRDALGKIHLAFYERPIIRLLEITQGKEPLIEPYKADLYPFMAIKGNSFILAFVGTPDPPEGSNDLYLAFREQGEAWSKITNIFHDSQRDAHHPAVAIDHNERIHVAWYAHQKDIGPVEVRHSVSSDGGITWEETLLFTDVDFFSNPLSLLVDEGGALHLTWSHWGTLPLVENYHAVWRNGLWSEPEQLFPGIKAKTGAFMVHDTQNRVHLLFSSASSLYHAIYE